MKVEKSVRDCWSEKMLNFTEAKSKLSLWYLNIETVKLVLLVLYEKVQFRKKCIYVKPVMIKSKCVWRHTLYTIRYSAPLKILKMVKKKTLICSLCEEGNENYEYFIFLCSALTIIIFFYHKTLCSCYIKDMNCCVVTHME